MKFFSSNSSNNVQFIMVKHRCKICAREFSSAHGLTQHCNTRHHGRTTSENIGERTQRQPSQAPIPLPKYNANL